jgi:hypothetical protein
MWSLRCKILYTWYFAIKKHGCVHCFNAEVGVMHLFREKNSLIETSLVEYKYWFVKKVRIEKMHGWCWHVSAAMYMKLWTISWLVLFQPTVWKCIGTTKIQTFLHALSSIIRFGVLNALCIVATQPWGMSSLLFGVGHGSPSSLQCRFSKIFTLILVP